MRRSLNRTVLVLAIAVAGCTDAQDGPGVPQSPSVAEQRELLGRTIAIALSDTEPRLILRDAMRESPLVDHKLPLENWMLTPAGARFAEMVAAGAGMSPDSLRRLVGGLAPVDLYFPRREDRETWGPAAAPVVIVEPGLSATSIRGFDTQGNLTIHPRSPVPLAQPALLLQASEGRDRRVRVTVHDQPTIQAPGASMLGGSITLAMAGQPIRRVELADSVASTAFMQQCPPELEFDCEGGGGGGGGVVGGGGLTYLNALHLFNVNDNGISGESNEFEFRATAYIGLQVIGQATLRLTGVSPNFDQSNMQRFLIGNAPDGHAYLEVDVVETDGWPNDDDQFDYAQYQPNQVFFKIPLNQYESGRWWPLKEQPYIGVFDPEKVITQFTWISQ